jgi:hypothetical protein
MFNAHGAHALAIVYDHLIDLAADMYDHGSTSDSTCFFPAAQASSR